MSNLFEKLKAVKNLDELDAESREELNKSFDSVSQVELTRNDLETVAGGGTNRPYGTCPKCGGETWIIYDAVDNWIVICRSCGKILDKGW